MLMGEPHIAVNSGKENLKVGQLIHQKVLSVNLKLSRYLLSRRKYHHFAHTVRRTRKDQKISIINIVKLLFSGTLTLNPYSDVLLAAFTVRTHLKRLEEEKLNSRAALLGSTATLAKWSSSTGTAGGSAVWVVSEKLELPPCRCCGLSSHSCTHTNTACHKTHSCA